jgi:hypothetical protein
MKSARTACAFFLFLQKDGGWRTNKEVAKGAEVAPRTAGAHTKALVDLQILEQAEIFPAHRYRIYKQAEKRNKVYMLALRKAAEALGLISE